MRFRPETHLGDWAIGLTAANVVLMFSWRLMGPIGAFPGLLCGLAAGIVAIVALRRGDRTGGVYLALVPLVLVVLFVTLELSLGHG